MVKPKGMSPEEARKILDKNPALRASGKNTNWVLERANKAWKDSEPSKSGDFFDAIVQVRASLRKEQKAIEDRIAELKKELEAGRDKACVHLFAWLQENDKAVGEASREAIEDEAAFLREIGFSLDRYKR